MNQEEFNRTVDILGKEIGTIQTIIEDMHKENLELRRKLYIASHRLKDACCCYGGKPTCIYCDAVEEIK